MPLVSIKLSCFLVSLTYKVSKFKLDKELNEIVSKVAGILISFKLVASLNAKKHKSVTPSSNFTEVIYLYVSSSNNSLKPIGPKATFFFSFPKYPGIVKFVGIFCPSVKLLALL